MSSSNQSGLVFGGRGSAHVTRKSLFTLSDSSCRSCSRRISALSCASRRASTLPNSCGSNTIGPPDESIVDRSFSFWLRQHDARPSRSIQYRSSDPQQQLPACLLCSTPSHEHNALLGLR